MRISKIHLTRFGHFTDHVVELPEDTGMHVLFGGNEAGKTTLLDSITYALFGWPSDRTSRTYAFQHKTSQLLTGLTLAGENGETVDIRRRKGNKATLMSPATGAAAPELEGQLAAMLRGLTADQWTGRHALTQARLRAGGEAMLASGGDASQAFAAAEDGIGVVYSVLEQITLRREALLTSAGRSGILLEQIKAYEAAAQVVKNVAADVDRYEHDVARRDEIAAELDRTRSEGVRLTTEAEHVAHSRSAAAELARWRELTAELEAVPELAAPWSAADHDVYVTMTGAIALLRTRVASLEAQVASAEEKLAEHVVDEALLGAGDEIAALQERLGQVRDARAELPSLEASVLVAERELASAMQEAALDCDPAEVAKSVPARALREALRSAAAQRTELERDAATARTALEAAKAAQCDAEHVLEALGVGGADTEAALTALLADGATIQPDRHRATAAGLQARRDALEHRASALPGCTLGLTGVRSLAMPAEADVAAVRAHLDALDAASAEQRQIRQNAVTHLADKRHELEDLEAGDNVPDVDALAALRETRDEVWGSIRAAIVGPAEDLAEARAAVPTFDNALRDADSCADAIASDGERAGQVAALRRTIVADEQRERSADAELTRIDAERAALIDGAWTALWKTAGVEATSPQAMDAFTADVALLRSDIALLEAEETTFAAEEARVAGLARELRAALGASTATDASDDITAFAALRAQAIELRKHHDGVREKRAAAVANLETATRQLDAATRAADAADRELRDHAIVWAGAGDAMSFNVSKATPDAAGKRCDALDVVDSAVAEMHTAVAARDAARTRVERFAADVETVVAALGGADHHDLAAPELVASTLGAAVREVEKAEQRRAAARDRLAELSTELETRRGELFISTSRLDGEIERVGVADADALASLDAAWSAREALLTQLRELDTELLSNTRLSAAQLLELRGTDDDAALAARIAQLVAQADELVAAAAALTQERDVLVERIGSAESSSAVAEARQQQATALARVEQLVPELRSLAIQERMLIEFLELQMQAARGPLLDRASDYFARLTCARYAGIALDRTDAGDAVLLARRHSDGMVAVDGLSEGARDQFFLALRLASLVTELEAGGEPMPLIVDDILLAFDDERSRATLEILGEVAELTQIVFLTHHAHLADMARTGADRGSLIPIAASSEAGPET